MKKIILFTFCIVSISCKVYPQSSTIDSTIISQIIAKHVDQDLFEGTILLADQGKIVYQHSNGYIDREANIPMNNEARFSIASITKMITAIVILQLVEEGKLSFEDHIHKHLPEFDIPNADKMTIHHLLLHISGLPNESDKIYLSPTTPTNYVKSTLKQSYKGLKFGQFNYANIDYVLLGLIIEKISKMSWEEAVQKRIIDKLQLTNTGFLKKEAYPTNYANTYGVSKAGVFTRDPVFYIENFYAAACMYSSAADLLLIDQALYDETLLSEKSKNKMFTSYPEYNYTGYSVWTYQYPFVSTYPKIMERRGGILGANVVLLRLLDTNKTIIILSNNNQFDSDSFGNKNSLKEALLIAFASQTIE